ncbi:hypothetical protein L3X38_031031 [Prunus dulcis]|uniref:Uncharacterized protein n=1 Tax=Prunus dulcis TaxID=3755 RepID=A0AAD4VBB1_PRUDU|nr:hypothetical protein L3X38_031031 [Prunus dulcis]
MGATTAREAWNTLKEEFQGNAKIGFVLIYSSVYAWVLRAMYSAEVWPGQKAKISTSLAPAQRKQLGQAAGPTSPGRPKGENRLGSSPSSGDVKTTSAQ